MCNDDWNIDGGQKDALLRKANIKKNYFLLFQQLSLNLLQTEKNKLLIIKQIRSQSKQVANWIKMS